MDSASLILEKVGLRRLHSHDANLLTSIERVRRRPVIPPGGPPSRSAQPLVALAPPIYRF